MALSGVVVLACVFAADLNVVSAWVQAPAVPLPAARAPIATDYVFRTDAGLLVFHVRPEKATDFEYVMARLSQGLESAPDTGRRQQKAGIRLFRSTESTPTSTVYVVVIDPVVAGADYDPVRMVTELLPSEASALYERLREAVLKVERVGLALVR